MNSVLIVRTPQANVISSQAVTDPLTLLVQFRLKLQPRNHGVPDLLKLDATYKSSINKYIRWVDKNSFVSEGSDIYTSPCNVDMYFCVVISLFTCRPENARKYFLALKKMNSFEMNTSHTANI